MSLISGRIVSCVSYDCGLLVNSLDWAFDLASLSLELPLRHLFSVGQLESSILSLDWILRFLDCFVSSPLGLWNLPLHLHAIVTNLDDELQRRSVRRFTLA